MEQPFNEEENTMRKLIEASGLEKPSASFAANIMKKIDVKPAVSTSTPTPLVSMGGWIVLIALFVGSSSLLYFYPISGISLSEVFMTTTSQMKEITPSFHISKRTLYACLFLALFLIQIPFLKRFLDKQRA